MFTMGVALRGGETDPLSGNVVALLHFDGANGTATFTDQVAGNTWTVGAGSPTISTAESKFGGSSLALPHTPCRVESTAGALLHLPGDYSIEAWAWVDATADITIFDIYGSSSLTLRVTTAAVYHTRGIAATIGKSDGSALAGRWVHAYAGRSGTTNYVACNGQINSQTGASDSVSAGTYVSVGNSYTGSGTAGYVDELRVTKGVCRYTSDFSATLPTAPYPYP